MLWVYGQHKYVDSYSVGIDFSHQNPSTKVDLSTVRVKYSKHTGFDHHH